MDYHRILSRPMKLHFAGWETDTYRLQQAGWQLSAEQDIMRNAFSIALQNQQYNIRGMSARVDLDYMAASRSYNSFDFGVPEVPVMLASSFQSQLMGYDFNKYEPIDAVPQFMNQRIQRMEDMKIFAPNLVRTKEIIVPEYDVDQLLSMILEKQQPAREDYFKREIQGMHYEDIMRPQQKFHAQIISLAA